MNSCGTSEWPSADYSHCGDNAVGYMEVCDDGDDFYVLSSGAPNHEAEYGAVHQNPNIRCEYMKSSFFKLILTNYIAIFHPLYL